MYLLCRRPGSNKASYNCIGYSLQIFRQSTTFLRSSSTWSTCTPQMSRSGNQRSQRITQRPSPICSRPRIRRGFLLERCGHGYPSDKKPRSAKGCCRLLRVEPAAGGLHYATLLLKNSGAGQFPRSFGNTIVRSSKSSSMRAVAAECTCRKRSRCTTTLYSSVIVRKS